MRRAGGWGLGLLAVAAMAGGAWLAFRPILNREVVRLVYLSSPEARGPTREAFLSGARFALDEAGWRSGPYRVVLDVDPATSGHPYDILLTVDRQRLLQADFPEEPWNVSDPLPARPITLNLMPYLDAMGKAAADWSREIGVRDPAVVYDKADSFSDAIASTFRSEADSPRPPHGPMLDTAMGREAIVETILKTNPGLVFFAGESAPYSTGDELFTALRSKGYSGRLVMADADPEVSILAVPNHGVEGTLLISTIGPPSKEFAASYPPATARRPGPHAWLAYQLTKTVLEAIDKAASRRPIDLGHQAALLQPDSQPCYPYILRNGKFVFVRDPK